MLDDWRKTGWADPNAQWSRGLPTDPDRETWNPCTDSACPVNSATWYQALEYANWLSKQRDLAPCFRVFECIQFNEPPESFGLACYTEILAPSVYECEGYRLPTSAEWEYAARAGTATAFYSGPITSFDDNYECSEDPNLSPIAWYCADADPPEKPVAQLLPNGWGLYDVLGNVKEWTMDRARGLPVADPSTDPEALYDDGGAAVTRSCAVNGLAPYCRAAANLEAPRDARAAGIRLVRTLGVGTLPTLGEPPRVDAGVEPPDASVVE